MRIYVSNLSSNITEESLRATFATYGQVQSIQLLIENFSDRAKQLAFIKMPNVWEASAAVVKMNGCILDGRIINVKEENPGTASKVFNFEKNYH